MTSSSSPPMSDYGMWSFHIPAAAAFRAPSQTESPPMNNDDGSHGPAASAAASPGFDARSLVVKREPTAPLPLGDADVHRGVMLRRGGFDDGHQQALPPGAAVYHPFNPAVTLSSRLWTTESAADEYDAMAGSCGAGSLSGSDASCRPQPSAVSSDDRSSTSPATRAQTLNAADPAANSNSSSLLIGKPRTHAADICSVLFFSRPRSKGWPHHGRRPTFSIYPCPLSFCSSTASPVHVLMLSTSTLVSSKCYKRTSRQ